MYMKYWIILLLVYTQHVYPFITETYYFTVNPRPSQIVSQGSRVILNCDVNDRRNIVFSWTLIKSDVDRILIENTTRRYQLDGRLIINSVDKILDAGEFVCHARNSSSGWEITSTPGTLSVQWISPYADVELKRPRDGDLAAGQDVTLRCAASGGPETTNSPRITWFKNKIRIFGDESNHVEFINDAYRLKIIDINHEDNGVYSCEAENTAGRAQANQTFIININGGDNSAQLQDGLFSRTTTALKDTDVWIHCPFINAVKTEWYIGARNSDLIVNGTSSRMFVYSNGTLRINSLKRFDEGSYLCLGVGPDRVRQSFTAELVLAKIGRMTEDNFEPKIDLDKITVLSAGSDFNIKCLHPTGAPTPSMSWLRTDGRRLLTGNGIFIEGTTLILESAETGHSGTYTCQATNMAGQRSISLEIFVTEPPVLTASPVNTNINEGLPGVLDCSYSGSPHPWTTVSWLFNGEPLPSQFQINNEMIINNDTGRLTITRAQLIMAGRYACRVETIQQRAVQSEPAMLTVIKSLKFKPKPQDESLEIGSNSVIPCHVEAEDSPAVAWKKEGANQFPDGVSMDGTSLVFTNTSKEMAGNYTCTAISRNDLINSTIKVNIGRRPEILYLTPNTSITEGQTVMLDCEASGDPTPTILWTINNGLLNTSLTGRFTMMENNSIFISPVFISDNALYACIPGNSLGFVRSEMKLTVKQTFKHTARNGSFSVSNSTVFNDDQKIDMMKTIVIAICSALAYLALVISLTVWCSLRLMKKKKLQLKKMAENGVKPPLRPTDVSGSLKSETEQLMSDTRKTNSDSTTVIQHGRERVVIEERSKSGRKGLPRFNRNKLFNIGVLGKGIFGDVFLSKAPGLVPHNDEQLVYIKALSNKDEHVQTEFRSETDMFNKLNHSRVCKLLALCKNYEPIYMIMEYCEWGDLKQFLLATKRENGKHLAIQPPNVQQKINIAHQVALAMEHIASNRFVHKDLAARNILLEPNLTVKVASLSLSRDIYASEYVQSVAGLLIPLRWTSGEAWLDDDYSTKSDVWSYGCFLFELFSGADIPYSELTNNEVIETFEGSLTPPDLSLNLPRPLKSLASSCLSTDPRDRPDFIDIVRRFSKLHSERHL